MKRFAVIVLVCALATPTRAQIPDNAARTSSGKGWECVSGFLERGQRCVPVAKLRMARFAACSFASRSRPIPAIARVHTMPTELAAPVAGAAPTPAPAGTRCFATRTTSQPRWFDDTAPSTLQTES